MLVMLPVTLVLAASESYIQTLEGRIQQGDICTVIDDKFRDLTLAEWNQLNHLSVDNIVSFELRFDAPYYYQNTNFTCSLNVTIKYFTSRDQQTPDEISNVNLVVKYDKTSGSRYPVVAYHKFKNAFKVIVEVNSITSQELGQNIPEIFRVKNQIIVERKYPFNPLVTGQLQLQQVNSAMQSGSSRQLVIAWNAANFNHSEEYDVEWTYIDGESEQATAITTMYTTNGIIDIPDAKVEEWMRNDNTRVTVPGTTYTINLPYSNGYVLVRVRGAYYQLIPYVYKQEKIPLRLQTNWVYKNGENKSAIEVIAAHEPGMNWQYTAAFAEEGKRKEVIGYVDGTLRNRQSVTIANGDQTLVVGSTTNRQETAIVQETIYDNMGRPAANILPAPVRNNSLAYYPAFNKNVANQPFSYTDLNKSSGIPVGSCVLAGEMLNNNSGAAQYYSPGNTFLNDGEYYFTKYVPNAGNYPYSLIRYTPDNTGRVRQQGGVGSAFQIGSGHESQYFYGKPAQKELDRMFGAEAGDASHYLKNMVIDPNGQASITYLDAKGRTIATALAGASPENVEALPSATASEAHVRLNQRLIGGADFRRDASALQMQATATFLAAVSGDFKLHYSINPAALTTTHGQGQFCSNCAYEVVIEVRDDCGIPRGGTTSPAFTFNDVTCNPNAAPVSGTVVLDVQKRGEYSVTYTLRLSEEVVNNQVDYYIDNNSNLKKLQAFFEEELQKLDLAGCYSTCEECKLLGTTPDVFRGKVIELLSNGKFPGIDLGSAGSPIRQWIDNTWTALRQKCNTLASTCTAVSACETFLEQMKSDVKPGGQYAMYNSETFTYLERDINVLRFYNLNDPGNTEIYNFSYVDEAGATIYIRNLTEVAFIKAYIDHPEWADLFVKKHIEYCSYLWCKDAGYSSPAFNNEISYNFDKMLREDVATGTEAVAKNYYNRLDMMALLNADPFFNGGRGNSYKAAMQSDLNNLSAAIGFVVKDQSGNISPGKNIFHFIDWNLYCKPADFNASDIQFINSWWNCTPGSACRSVTREWELYRNYYLQLKSKYLHQAKEQANPACKDCFIGKDPIVQNECTTPVTADFTITSWNGRHGPVYEVIYKNGAMPFEHDYNVSYQYQLGAMIFNASTILPKGALKKTIWDTYQGEISSITITGLSCAGTGGLIGCSIAEPGPCPTLGDFTYREEAVNDDPPYRWDVLRVFYIHPAGPVTRPITVNVMRVSYSFTYGTTYNEFPVTMNPGESEIHIGEYAKEWSDLDFDGNVEEEEVTSYETYVASVSCPPVTPKPKSTCTDDPRFGAYSGKSRVFNGFVAVDSYTACSVPATVTVPTEAEMLNSLRTQEIANLEFLRSNWKDRLIAVRDEETIFSSIDNTTIDLVVEALYYVALKNIQVAVTKETIRPASTLPNGVQSLLSHTSFQHAFDAIVGTTLVRKGFSPYLLDKPYPNSKTPVERNPNTGDINSTLCSNLALLKARFTATGTGTFHAWLKEQLEEDFILTAAQLTDLENRCAASCLYLDDPLLLPAVLATPAPANSDHPFVGCTRITALNTTFTNLLSDVAPGSKLYRTLYTNYLNHQLGYALTYSEYADFQDKCSLNGTSVLFNKPASPLIVQDYLACVAPAIKGAYEHAGQEFDLYIALERRKFRNLYVDKCLGNKANATLEGDQYEYHYTLYYYDQSNNLVKTIPPEGVRLLSSNETDLVDEFRDFNTVSCTGFGIPTTENKTATFNAMSTALQNNTGKSMEMWLYSSDNNSSRQVRIITPDKKYFYQAAIYNKKLWVELYSLVPGTTDIEISLTNHAVADISQIPLQSWSHLVIQGADFNGAPWSLYLDGKKLTLIPSVNEPPYPFAWEIAAGFTVPAEEVALLKHVRFYSNTISDEAVYANYKNSCLSPAVAGLPLIVWGRFNIPAPGSETTTGPTSTIEVANRFIVPQHGLPTNYVYNSLSQVVQQTTPDAGLTQTWYDRLGRPAVTQTAEQLDPLSFAWSPNQYTYMKYDALGRVTETGNKYSAPGTVTETSIRDMNFLNSFCNTGLRENIRLTIYDVEPIGVIAAPYEYLNLRHRVAATMFLANKDQIANPLHQTLYSYDISGNVKKMRQVFWRSTVDWISNLIEYDYDLISGKVNQVKFNEGGGGDQFFYRYRYDADNRVVEARTSRDKLIWNTEATYRYHLHGPLARIELGEYKVQGLDYAYTLQGWMKGINSHRLDPAADMTQDGKTDNLRFSKHARDVMAYGMGYYSNDYTPVGGGTAFSMSYESLSNTGTGNNLYNGNISHTTLALGKLDNGTVKGYTYRYDQLHRLKQMRMHTIGAGATWNNNSIGDAYKEDVSYDANGNITRYWRYGNNPAKLLMDNLTYEYSRDVNNRLLNNKLTHVTDAVPKDDYPDIDGQSIDIDNQPAGAYEYDRNGNLIKDNAENIPYIFWYPDGKMHSFVKLKPNDAGVESGYYYDATGNRVAKYNRIWGDGPERTDWYYYIRDAQGNILAVYKDQGASGATNLVKTEQYLYGSSRLGTWNPDPNEPAGTLGIGQRSYELSNHLDNVLAVISDKKTGVDTDNNGVVDYYEAEVLSATDYYSFGMKMPGRQWGLKGYRFGFNGKENDNEPKGEGNQIDFGNRIYDARIGRFLSVDRLASEMPGLSTYGFAANNPIQLVDVDGDRPGLPPYHIVKAIFKESPMAFLAIFLSVNTSNYALYEWSKGTPEGRGHFSNLIGAVGESVAYNTLLTDFSISLPRMSWGIGLPKAKLLLGGYEGKWQVDVQEVQRVYNQPRGLFRRSNSAGVIYHNFDGSYGGIKEYYANLGESYEFRINYEVKTLSPDSSPRNIFEKLKEGFTQIRQTSTNMSRTAGVLVTDKESWLKVANDPVLGPQLKALFDSKNFNMHVRLIKNLSKDTRDKLFALRQGILDADKEEAKKTKTK